MPIEKRAIEQARTAHREFTAKIWINTLSALSAEFGTLEASYDSADKTCKATIKAINKERKDRLDEAWGKHQRDTKTREGSKYEAYRDDERSINENCNDRIEEAKQTRDKTCQAAEIVYDKNVKEILSRYKDEMESAVDKLIAEHP